MTGCGESTYLSQLAASWDVLMLTRFVMLREENSAPEAFLQSAC